MAVQDPVPWSILSPPGWHHVWRASAVTLILPSVSLLYSRGNLASRPKPSELYAKWMASGVKLAVPFALLGFPPIFII